MAFNILYISHRPLHIHRWLSNKLKLVRWCVCCSNASSSEQTAQHYATKVSTIAQLQELVCALDDLCGYRYLRTHDSSTVMFQITASEFGFRQGGVSHPVTLFVTTILIYSEHDFRCENDSYAYLDSAGILLFRLLRGCGRWTALSCRQRGSQLQLQPATSVNKVILSN